MVPFWVYPVCNEYRYLQCKLDHQLGSHDLHISYFRVDYLDQLVLKYTQYKRHYSHDEKRKKKKTETNKSLSPSLHPPPLLSFPISL